VKSHVLSIKMLAKITIKNEKVLIHAINSSF
jgi:hypothetical protein